MTHDEMIAVIAAHRDGEAIQIRGHGDSPWTEVQDGDSPRWLFALCDYRIKPEPLECWVNVYGDGSSTSYRTEERARQQNSIHFKPVRIAVHMKEVES